MPNRPKFISTELSCSEEEDFVVVIVFFFFFFFFFSIFSYLYPQIKHRTPGEDPFLTMGSLFEQTRVLEWVGKHSETDSIKTQISSKTSCGKKDGTKRRHQSHHLRQPGGKPFPIQVVTG